MLTNLVTAVLWLLARRDFPAGPVECDGVSKTSKLGTVIHEPAEEGQTQGTENLEKSHDGTLPHSFTYACCFRQEPALPEED